MFGTSTSIWKSTLVSLTAGVTLLVLWKAWKIFLKKDLGWKRKLKNASSYIKDKSIKIVTTTEEWELVYFELMDGLKHKKVLGLDCEWVGKNKVALLQLCNPLGLCVLVRLSLMTQPFPESLQTLLGDKNILKTGVAVFNDGKKLYQDHGLLVAGCVDLRHVLERVRGVFDCQSVGLKGLSSGILCVEISKDYSIRCGNWEVDCYSQAQIDYAATDAAVGVDIFTELVWAKMASTNEEYTKYSSIQMRLQTSDSSDYCDVDSVTKMASVNENVSNEVEENFWRVARSLCQGIVDVTYTFHSKNGSQMSSSNPKKKVKDDKEIYSTRKRPLWDNCRLEAPDGTTLCTCDRRKAQWYLDKGLADKVCDDPIIVRLRFEPSSRPENERNYYLQEKENQCVVCGADKDYVRKFVIPFEYKKFFPSALKDHSSHDVLLLCTSCHRRSCDFDSILRRQLGEECDAPIDSGSTSKTLLDHDLQKIRSAGRALKLNGKSIPPNRVMELEKLLLDFFGVESISDEILDQASDIDARQVASGYVPHGKKVVRHMAMNGGLLAFQTRWRQHFLNTMNPQFLPAFWSVDYIPEGWSKMT